MDIREHLARLGLAGKRGDIYLALLRGGAATATQIARATRFKRPTVYDILAELQRLELVSETSAGKRRLFAAEGPERLEQMLERQREHLRAALPELQALHGQGPGRPKVRLYEGVEGVRSVNEDILTARSGEYFWFGSIKEIVDVVGRDYLEDWVRRRIEKGIWSNSIRVREKDPPEAYLTGGAKNLRRLRFISRPVREDIAGLYIYDNKVAVTSALKECYGLIVESRELAALLLTLWRVVWDVAEES
jgi:HTH-type transcriptional regulator, sugar sensing transcriptional regulator